LHGQLEKNKMNTVVRTLAAIREVEDKFSKIQGNPALFGAENGGLTKQELELLEKLIGLSGEVNIAGDAILKRYLPSAKKVEE
jgi:tRNA C32,U32 (ribose-2'-O)-methylase TrmJ